MTIICALHRDGETWIGSDTVAHYLGCRVTRGPKWTSFKGWAVGLAGDQAAHCLIMKHAAHLLDIEHPADFVGRLRQVLKEADFDLKPASDNAPPNCAQDMLLASRDGAWIVPATFSYLEAPGFWAQGHGKDLALGAVHALRADGKTDPEILMCSAIEAAIELSTGCGGEPWIAKL